MYEQVVAVQWTPSLISLPPMNPNFVDTWIRKSKRTGYIGHSGEWHALLTAQGAVRSGKPVGRKL